MLCYVSKKKKMLFGLVPVTAPSPYTHTSTAPLLKSHLAWNKTEGVEGGVKEGPGRKKRWVLIGPFQVTGNRHKHLSWLCRLTLCTHFLPSLNFCFATSDSLLSLSHSAARTNRCQRFSYTHLVFITVQQKPSITSWPPSRVELKS